ncbi:MAG TPA: DNA recombination protein RmuC [Patescibacteria group bacterium]
MLPVYFLLAIIIALLGYFIYESKKKNNVSALSDDFFQKFNEKFPLILNQANASLISMADQKIGTDFQNKKDSIEKMVQQVLDGLAKNQSELVAAEKDRVGSFNGLREAIENNQRLTEQLKVTADSLRNVLSNNQMRGAFGEKVAEDLLKQSGFVIGTDYSKQEADGTSRPDFTVYLPDKTKINVDSKFPYTNIVKMSETDDAVEKNRYLKLFEQDIKKKIADVCGRDYIDPEKNTVDFCIVFIPNEMVFSFIYEKFPDVLEEAFRRKIVFAGPFSFTAILRMVRQAYDNFRYQSNVQSIISYIKIFEKEFGKYNEEFDKIGLKIDSLSRQYSEVSSVRTNKLIRVIDKIKIEDNSGKHVHELEMPKNEF